MFILCVFGLIFLVEFFVVVRVEREDYVDFLEEKKKEVELNVIRVNIIV